MSNAQLEAVKSGKTRKILKLCLFAVANIGIVVYIAVKEFGPEARGVQSITKLDINMAYLIFAVACFGAAALMETLKYRSMMITATDRADLRGAYECAVLGKFTTISRRSVRAGSLSRSTISKNAGFPTAPAPLPIAGFLVLQTAFVLVALWCSFLTAVSRKTLPP